MALYNRKINDIINTTATTNKVNRFCMTLKLHFELKISYY